MNVEQITLKISLVSQLTTPCLCGAFILHHIHNGLTHCLRPLISTFKYDKTTHLFKQDIQMKQVTVLLTGFLELLGPWLVLMVTLFSFLSSLVKEFRSFGSKIPTIAQQNLP